MPDQPAVKFSTDEAAAARERESAEPGVELVLEDLLIEDVSIDGMCGVY